MFTYFFQEITVCYVIDSIDETLYFDVYTVLDLVIASALPFIIIFCCNIAIMVRLNLYQRQRSTMQITSLQGPNLSSMTSMLLCTSFCFILLTLPICIFLAWEGKTSDLLTLADSYIAWAVCSLLVYINCSINFFLFILSGTRFRREWQKMIRCLICCQAEPQTTYERNTAVTGVSVIELEPTHG